MRTGSSVRPISSSSRLPARFAVLILAGSNGGRLVGLLGLDDIDAGLGQHGQRVFDLFGRELVRWQRGVQFVIGDVAPFLAARDHLADGLCVAIDHQAFGRLVAGFVHFRRIRCFGRHLHPVLIYTVARCCAVAIRAMPL